MALDRGQIVTKEALIEKIESLPPEKKAEVERLVDSLAAETAANGSAGSSFPAGLIERINARREALLKDHGTFNTLPYLREFRETGGR
jgi:hypothetical protein